jgi:hypothetical protein
MNECVFSVFSVCLVCVCVCVRERRYLNDEYSSWIMTIDVFSEFDSVSLFQLMCCIHKTSHTQNENKRDVLNQYQTKSNIQSQSKREWVSEWVSEWMNEWMNEWMSE